MSKNHLLLENLILQPTLGVLMLFLLTKEMDKAKQPTLKIGKQSRLWSSMWKETEIDNPVYSILTDESSM